MRTGNIVHGELHDGEREMNPGVLLKKFRHGFRVLADAVAGDDQQTSSPSEVACHRVHEARLVERCFDRIDRGRDVLVQQKLRFLAR